MTYKFPESILKRHIFIGGMTGAGKSSTERLIVEQVVAQGARVCVLDTVKSDWWGITSSRSGKRAGLPFKILGGPRGHVKIESSAGKVVGQLVGSGKLPLSIIDMANFEAGGLQRFFIDFASALWNNTKGVVYLVIEEAHEVAPKERAGIGAESMAIHWAKKLATGSRTKGIRLIVATQRTQSLHNAVLSSCETVITHRIGFADDQKPILKWIKTKIGKDNAALVEAELANLPDGVGYLAAGAPIKVFERIKFPLFRTFDNTATPEDSDDLSKIATAPVDANELRAIIGDAVKEAEANDLPTLRKQLVEKDKKIADLERKASQVVPVDPKAIEAADKAGFERAKKEAVSAARDLITTEVAAIEKALGDLVETSKKAMYDYRDLVGGRLHTLVRTKQTALIPAYAPIAKPMTDSRFKVALGGAHVPSSFNQVSAEVGDMPLAARKMLAVIDTNPPVKRSWFQVAMLARLKARGGSFGNAKKILVESGLISEAAGLVWINNPTGPEEPPMDQATLVATWCDRLSGGAPKILQWLYENGGRAPLVNIAAGLGVASRGGAWGNAWKELRNNGIVTVTGGEATLTEMFFPT